MKTFAVDIARATARTLRRLFVALLLALPVSASGAVATVSGVQPPLPAAIAVQLQAQGLQGAVWSLVTPDGAIATGAAGVRDAREGTGLDAGHRVHVGSVAKALLAAGVLRLVTQGRLGLDTPVSELLPQVAFDNPWAGDPVRVRHLLDHTAGLDDARFSQVFSLRADPDAPLAQAFQGVPLRVRCRPGTRHSYSNAGYTLLGMVVEAVTGARYEAYLDAHLLRPLGMHDSTFAFTTQAGPRADPRLAMGHFERGAAQAAVPMVLRPAGQFTTTAADMGRFARFLMGDGHIDGAPFIAPALLRAMGQPVATEAATAGLRVGYGLGLATRDRHGAVGRCHGGSTVGYRAMLCLFPRQQRAFFLAINADVENADYGRFERLLMQALRVQRDAVVRAAAASVDAGAWTGHYIPSPNRFARFAGPDAALNFVRVRVVANTLRFKPFQSVEVALQPVGGALFRASERVIASHALVRARDGGHAISTGLQTYEKVSLLRLVPLWASLVAGLLGVAWLLVAGIVRLAWRRGAWFAPVLVPFMGIVALCLPLPLFLRQSFLQLGDLTLASGLLAAVTSILPLTMLVGLGWSARRRPWSRMATLDALSMLAVLQLTGVLAWWGLVPLRLWA